MPTPLQIIQANAPKYGLDPAAVVAYALTQGGTSWGAVGDNNSSFGPFQAHIGGAAGNRSVQDASTWANSPEGLISMMQTMASAGAKGRSGPEAAAYIVGPSFGRGANPASDEAKARAAYPQATKLLGGSAPISIDAVPTSSALPGTSAMPTAAALPATPTLPTFSAPTNFTAALSAAPPTLAAGATPLQTARSRAEAFTTNLLSAQQQARASAPSLATMLGQISSTPEAQASRKVSEHTTPTGVPVEIEGKPTTRSLQAVKLAESFIGTPYQAAGESPSGFDCSGLLQYVWGQKGVSIPRTTFAQWDAGTPVQKGQLAPGDAVYFTGADPQNGKPGHVGMYIGGGKFVEAPHTGAQVRVSTLAGRTDYVGARRFA